MMKRLTQSFNAALLTNPIAITADAFRNYVKKNPPPPIDPGMKVATALFVAGMAFALLW